MPDPAYIVSLFGVQPNELRLEQMLSELEQLGVTPIYGKRHFPNGAPTMEERGPAVQIVLPRYDSPDMSAATTRVIMNKFPNAQIIEAEREGGITRAVAPSYLLSHGEPNSLSDRVGGL